MKKTFFQRSLLLIICISLIINITVPLFADSYKKDSKVDTDKYYTSSNTEMEDLFDFGLKDIPNALVWFFNFKTFTVLKETEFDSGDKYIKGFWNTPNLQMLTKNLVTKDILDGFVNTTYDVNETEFIVNVGKNATKENAITRYGFKIPSYKYVGEYPKLYMSVQDIMPSGVLSTLWRFIKSLFGFSFIKAPDGKNFKTISYYNHTYTDKDERLVKFIKKYWIKYLIEKLDDNQFKDPDDFREDFVEKDDVKEALKKRNSQKVEFTETALKYWKGLLGKPKPGLMSNTKTGDEISDEDFEKYFEKYTSKGKVFEKGKATETIENIKSHLRDYINEQRNKDPDKRDKDFDIDKLEALITPEMELALELEDELNGIYDDYLDFKEDLDSGKESDKDTIHYNQCLIKCDKDAKEGECYSTALSEEKTTLYIGNVLGFSGVDKITEGKDKLTNTDAVELINTMQSYCGPYYPEVMSNIIICMNEVAGKKLRVDDVLDKRVMPYDVNSMTLADKENFTIVDPRVSKYRKSFVGSLVADVQLRNGFALPNYFAEFMVNNSGFISELSVAFQQLINFDMLDNLGLSPAKLWKSPIITIIMMFFVLAFFIKTIKLVFTNMKSVKNIPKKLIVFFLILALELGMFSVIALKPEETWNKTKYILTNLINMGEIITVNNDTTIDYLFGDGPDRDPATTYYLPYLDIWSSYNTGYGLFDKEQLISNCTNEDDNPEISDIKKTIVKINGKKIDHWSVLLADSFSYYGESKSNIGFVDETGKLVNGQVINNNAYRVVDHYLAPRVLLDKYSGEIDLETKQNENYNGKFQKGFARIIPKFICVLLMFWLSLLKLLIFLWIWYLLFIFAYKAFLSRFAEHKSWKQILGEVFMPILDMIFIGIFAGITLIVNSNVSSNFIISTLVMVFLFLLSVKLLAWRSRKKYFAKTLLPLIMLTDYKDFRRDRQDDYMDSKSLVDAKQLNIELTREIINDPEKYRLTLFTESNAMRSEYMQNKYITVYENWVADIARRISAGGVPTISEVMCLENFADFTNRQYNVDTFQRKQNIEPDDDDDSMNTEYENSTQDYRRENSDVRNSFNSENFDDKIRKE